MTSLRAVLALSALTAAACSGDLRRQEAGEAPSADSARLAKVGDAVAVVLDSAAVRRMGLETITLVPATRPAEMELPAEAIVDPQAVTTLRTAVAGRLRETEGHTWPTFGSRIERGMVLGQVSDALPLVASRSGTVSRVLAQPGELVQAGQELLELTDYEHPLVRVAWPSGGPEAPAGVSLGLPGGADRHPASLLGPAAEADPLTRGPAFLYRLRAPWAELRPGAALVAFVPERRVAGTLFLPDRAVVQWNGLAWAYVERTAGSFVRVRLDTQRPVRGGWLVASRFARGDRIVTTGAEQLLSEEFRARIVVGEEVGE